MKPRSFSVSGGQFLMDGQPFRVLSGAIHYFRIHPAYWRDSLQNLLSCGFNTVETYIPWNFHEPDEGRYRFDGWADLAGFIKLAGEMGLQVILRPGPYICAEWEFGGFPWWLMRDRNMRLRCDYQPYLERIRRWFEKLMQIIAPHLCTACGPVIAVQVENEYGSYGSDKTYLSWLRDLLIELGINCLLFTADGGEDLMLEGGKLLGIHQTATFGSDPESAFAALRRAQPAGPDMCSEYWCGWFDHWGEEHHTRDPAEAASTLERMLAMGASVNLYMFHGGTNFGFWNGANLDRYSGKYQPTTTSYDYNAPLDEAGNATPLYDACKRVIEAHFGPIDIPAAPRHAARAYGELPVTECLFLTDALPPAVRCAYPMAMEEAGQGYGYILYSTWLPEHAGSELEVLLTLREVRDRANVLLNGQPIAAIYRNDAETSVKLWREPGKMARLDILVENMGRVNYGTMPPMQSGITSGILINHQYISDWEIRPLPLTEPPAFAKELTVPAAPAKGPAFYRAALTVSADELADTYLDMANFNKGIVFINGFNLGRYWREGPLSTLYIPAPLIMAGENEVVIFETDECVAPVLRFTDRHELTK